MGLIEELNGFVSNITYDDSLSSLLKGVMDAQLTEEPAPRNYYYITHVTNPAQTFFSRIHPNIKRPQEIARKLAYGKQLHNFAGIWFKNLPDFCAEEGLLDGAWVDIPGVRGKIDHRLGDSLLEFKTKDTIPNTSEEIFSRYPQDLEQIVFYSVIHPSSPKNNYLVFMKNSKPFEIKAFKIDIKSKKRVKSILLSRISLLDEAFEKQDPSKLGRCRYFDTGCQYQLQELCSCKDLAPLNTVPLQKSVEITYDEDFTKQLIKAREESGIPSVFCLTTRDMLVPRKHYMEAISGVESSYYYDEAYEYKACLWASIGNLKRHHGIDLDKTERQTVAASLRDPRARIGFRWLKMKSSVHRGGETVPYIENVSMRDNMKYTKPDRYHLAELGIICALHGKNKGLMIRVFPKLNKLVLVYQITYRNHEEMFRKVKAALDLTQTAEENEDLLALSPCPPFMNDNGKCPLMAQCNVKGARGCR